MDRAQGRGGDGWRVRAPARAARRATRRARDCARAGWPPRRAAAAAPPPSAAPRCVAPPACAVRVHIGFRVPCQGFRQGPAREQALAEGGRLNTAGGMSYERRGGVGWGQAPRARLVQLLVGRQRAAEARRAARRRPAVTRHLPQHLQPHLARQLLPPRRPAVAWRGSASKRALRLESLGQTAAVISVAKTWQQRPAASQLHAVCCQVPTCTPFRLDSRTCGPACARCQSKREGDVPRRTAQSRSAMARTARRRGWRARGRQRGPAMLRTGSLHLTRDRGSSPRCLEEHLLCTTDAVLWSSVLGLPQHAAAEPDLCDCQHTMGRRRGIACTCLQTHPQPQRSRSRHALLPSKGAHLRVCAPSGRRPSARRPLRRRGPAAAPHHVRTRRRLPPLGPLAASRRVRGAGLGRRCGRRCGARARSLHVRAGGLRRRAGCGSVVRRRASAAVRRRTGAPGPGQVRERRAAARRAGVGAGRARRGRAAGLGLGQARARAGGRARRQPHRHQWRALGCAPSGSQGRARVLLRCCNAARICPPLAGLPLVLGPAPYGGAWGTGVHLD